LGSPSVYIDRDELKKRLGDIEGLVSQGHDKVNQEIIELAPKLRVIANFGAGYDTVEVKYATEVRICVFSQVIVRLINLITSLERNLGHKYSYPNYSRDR
jgi:phosphoglycerate dehydrogenase-like enzyme